MDIITKFDRVEGIESLKPHFSSLDSIVLAVKVLSDFLREELVIEEDTINNALISNFSVKAGKSLVEDLKNVTAKLSLSIRRLMERAVRESHLNSFVSDFKEGGFDLLAFGRPLLINENWFDEITEEA